MCKSFWYQYEECEHEDSGGSHRNYKSHCSPYDTNNGQCDGVKGIVIPLARQCEDCMVMQHLPFPKSCQLSTPSPRINSMVEYIINLVPDKGPIMMLRDPKTRQEHGYVWANPREWDEPISDIDLEFLMWLEKGFHDVYWQRKRAGKPLGVGPIMFYAHIRAAYYTGLSKFLFRLRVNGLRHIKLEPPPEIVREERMEIILERLWRIAKPIPAAKLAADEACVVCQDEFGGTEDAIKLPCKCPLIGKECLKHWVKSWDKESQLRVCPICKDNFDLTKLDPKDQVLRAPRPGFEPAPPGTRPSSAVVSKLIWDSVTAKARHPTKEQHDIPSPWWMNVLRG